MRRQWRIAAVIGLWAVLASPLAAKSVDEYLDEMREGYPASIGKALKGDAATAREILRRCAAKSEWRRRSACMFLASDLADPKRGDAIRPFLDDENRHVREQAVGVYSEAVGLRAVDELERIADAPPLPPDFDLTQATLTAHTGSDGGALLRKPCAAASMVKKSETNGRRMLRRRLDGDSGA